MPPHFRHLHWGRTHLRTPAIGHPPPLGPPDLHPCTYGPRAALACHALAAVFICMAAVWERGGAAADEDGPLEERARRLPTRIGPSGMGMAGADEERPVWSRGWQVLMWIGPSGRGANAEVVIQRKGAAPTNLPLSIGECDPSGCASTRLSDAASDGASVYQTWAHNPTL